MNLDCVENRKTFHMLYRIMRKVWKKMRIRPFFGTAKPLTKDMHGRRCDWDVFITLVRE